MKTLLMTDDTIPNTDHEYREYLLLMRRRFQDRVSGPHTPLFTTDATDLWSVYLDSFTDPAERQYHNCHCCRQFIERYGGLVTIDEHGRPASPIWDVSEAPELYKPAVEAMLTRLRKAKITGVFLSSEKEWGTPVTGVWRHFSVIPVSDIVHRRATQTAGQAMAEKREDFKNVRAALREFTKPHLETALRLLRSDALYRSEKVLGQAEWLYALHNAKHPNLIWRAVATAPAGFCHPRSGMIGTLLEDIADPHKDFDDVARAFKAKMHPLAYQRPKAAPTTGAIAAAEKIVAQLGAAGSLARRFARLDDLVPLWTPAPEKAPARNGVFGHLSPKGTSAPSDMRIPETTITWEKFQRTVLPTAERIEARAPSHGNYFAFVTAVNREAPPILQWDREDARNPVSTYVYHGGSSAHQFGLTANAFVPVEMITLRPEAWTSTSSHHSKGVCVVLAGARETRSSGLAIFPESLRSEFHGIRSVLEAYSKSGTIEGIHEPHAAGIQLGGAAWGIVLRVWTGNVSQDYRLDRWD